MSTPKRPLFADFQLHTGDDSDFKNELIILMIANVHELKRAVDLSTGAFDQIRFAAVCHKVTTTMSILDDVEFSGLMDAIRRNGENTEKILLFDALCSQVISSLQAELSINDAAAVFP
jgi:hypothetical protein